MSVPETTLRRATTADAASLADIGRRTFTETFAHLYPPEDLAAFLDGSHSLARAKADLADPDCAIWMAEQQGETVGYALAGRCGLPHAEVTADCSELKRLYLLRGAQNGGTGARLFERVLAWTQAAGPRAVWIGVWSQNFGAQRFYARHGFEQVGEYGFPVGRTVDREFILRRNKESFSTTSSRRAGSPPD